jgi:uncharacterized protein YecT (DUF1311 family)
MQKSVRAAITVTAIVTLAPLQVWAQVPHMDDSLRDCSAGRSHFGMRDCLSAKASDSAAKLKEIESAFLSHLLKSGEQRADIATAQKAFYDAKQAFEGYRNDTCDFYGSMAMGGNSAGDLVLACVVMLNSERSAQLKWASEHWQGYGR